MRSDVKYIASALALGLALSLPLGGCGGGDGSSAPDPIATATPTPSPTPTPTPTPPPPDPIALTPIAPPVVLTAQGARFYSGIAYGPAAAHRLDLFLPHGDTPTGIVVFAHGGSFAAGSRTDPYANPGWAAFIDAMLGANIAFASIDYRLLGGNSTRGVMGAMNDAARAVQFLRYHSAQLKLDQARVVMVGGSAGAGTALYVALSPEMAHANSPDPVLRQSSRVRGAYGLAPQAGYDLPAWPEDVFSKYRSQGLDWQAMRAIIGVENVLRFYGIASLAELGSPQLLEDRRRLDFLAQIGADDPELFLESRAADVLPSNQDSLTHHPLHVAALADAGSRAGRPVKARAPALGIDTTGGEDVTAWAIRVLR